jgi:PAS domain S-box-containing protein
MVEDKQGAEGVPQEEQSGTRWRMAAWRVVWPYVTFAGLWILLSDTLLAAVVRDARLIERISIFKGLAFVLVTALLLYGLLRRELLRRHRMETAQRASAAERRALFDHLPQRIFFKDMQSVYRSCNTAFAADIGLTEEALIGKTDFDLCPHDLAEKYRADDQAIMDNAQPFEGDERAVLGGQERWVHIVKTPVRDDTGKLLGVLGILWDITAERAAAAALRESEENHRRLVEELPDAIAIHRDGLVLYVNPAGVQLCGAAQREQLLGHSIFERLHPDDHALVRARIATVLQGGQVPLVEERLVRLDGALVVSETATTRVMFNGAPAVQSLLRNVTARVRAEAARRESEERLHMLIQSSPDTICFKDGAGRWLIANASHLDLFQVRADNYQGRTDQELAAGVPPDAREVMLRCRESDEEIWRKGQPCHFEETFPQADDKHQLFAVAKVPLFNPDGSRKGLIAVAHDITARRRSEEQIRRLATVVEQATEAVIMTDMVGAIIYVNPAFERSSGYPAQEVLGRNPRCLKSGRQDAECYRAMWAALTAGQHWHGHLANRRKDGSLYDVEAIIAPIHDDAGHPRYYVASERDVTRELQLEHQFRQAQKMETIGRLAGGVAHDFNNLLQAILGFVELLLANTPEGDQRHGDLLQVQRAAGRAAELTRQLLAFSRKQMIEPRIFDINAMIVDMGKLLHRVLGDGVVLVTELHPALHRIKADPHQIEQALLNMAVNARDAMPQGGRLTIRTANVTFGPTEAAAQAEVHSGEFISLSITDTGQGMTPEVLEHIFEPFFSTKGVGQGTGLGLSVIYGIVKQNNGWVNVYSQPGQGATFTLHLPAYLGVEPVTPPDAVRLEQQVPRGRGEHILLVEDEPEVRNLAAHVLQAFGYVLTVAESAAAARAVLAAPAQPFAALFSDIALPDGNGIALADEIRVRQPGLPVLLCSGYSDALTRWTDINTKGYHFLQKPYPAAALLTLLRHVLDTHAPAPA